MVLRLINFKYNLIIDRFKLIEVNLGTAPKITLGYHFSGEVAQTKDQCPLTINQIRPHACVGWSCSTLCQEQIDDREL